MDCDDTCIAVWVCAGVALIVIALVALLWYRRQRDAARSEGELRSALLQQRAENRRLNDDLRWWERDAAAATAAAKEEEDEEETTGAPWRLPDAPQSGAPPRDTLPAAEYTLPAASDDAFLTEAEVGWTVGAGRYWDQWGRRWVDGVSVVPQPGGAAWRSGMPPGCLLSVNGEAVYEAADVVQALGAKAGAVTVRVAPCATVSDGETRDVTHHVALDGCREKLGVDVRNDDGSGGGGGAGRRRVVVTKVVEGGVAQRHGLQADQVLVEMDGVAVASKEQLMGLVKAAQEQERTELRFKTRLRDADDRAAAGHARAATATAAEEEEEEGEDAYLSGAGGTRPRVTTAIVRDNGASLGFFAAENAGIGRAFLAAPPPEGSPLWHAGVPQHAVLLSIAGVKVRAVGDIQAAVDAARAAGTKLLTIEYHVPPPLSARGGRRREDPGGSVTFHLDPTPYDKYRFGADGTLREHPDEAGGGRGGAARSAALPRPPDTPDTPPEEIIVPAAAVRAAAAKAQAAPPRVVVVEAVPSEAASSAASGSEPAPPPSPPGFHRLRPHPLSFRSAASASGQQPQERGGSEGVPAKAAAAAAAQTDAEDGGGGGGDGEDVDGSSGDDLPQDPWWPRLGLRVRTRLRSPGGAQVYDKAYAGRRGRIVELLRGDDTAAAGGVQRVVLAFSERGGKRGAETRREWPWVGCACAVHSFVEEELDAPLPCAACEKMIWAVRPQTCRRCARCGDVCHRQCVAQP